MPTVQYLPTAKSGYEKICKLFPSWLTVWFDSQLDSNDSNTAIWAKVYRKGLLHRLFSRPVAKLYISDQYVQFEVRERLLLDEFSKIARKFEEQDQRRVGIKTWV
jgi:hypothetical protein